MVNRMVSQADGESVSRTAHQDPVFRAACKIRAEALWKKRRAGLLPLPKRTPRGPNKPKVTPTPAAPAVVDSRLQLSLDPDAISPTELRALVRRRITEALIRGADVRDILAASKTWEALFGESDFRVTDEERELILKWRAYRAGPAVSAEKSAVGG